MNEEIKKEWLEALRSGEYKQGRGLMKNDANEYCCLGVLGCLYAKANNLEWNVKLLTEQENESRNYSLNLAPSDLVYNWAGLKKNRFGNNNPEIVAEGINKTLAELNDTGSTFEQIANLIEEHL